MAWPTVLDGDPGGAAQCIAHPDVG
jgi:hypothetical protein